MGFVFLLFLILAGVLGIAWFAEENMENKIAYTLGAGIVCSVLLVFMMLVILGFSYGRYISMIERLSTIEQYKESIDLYASKGVAEFKFDTDSSKSSELTDLKYNNYQSQIGQMISDLRDAIIDYNQAYASKRAMKNSWFWSWCIILDDGMRPIKMSDYLK